VTNLLASKIEDAAQTQWQLKQNLGDLQRRTDLLLAQSGVGSAEFKADAKEVRRESELPDLWNDPTHGQQVMAKLQRIEVAEKRAQAYRNMDEEVQAALELAEEAEGDMEEYTMLMEEASAALERWEAELSQAEVEMMMGGRYDAHSCQT